MLSELISPTTFTPFIEELGLIVLVMLGAFIALFIVIGGYNFVLALLREIAEDRALDKRVRDTLAESDRLLGR